MAEEDEDQLQQITTGDPNAVKQLLDEFAVKVVGEQDYDQNLTVEHVKLVFMVASCIVACIAQFWDKIDKSYAFPANRDLLYICCFL